MRNILVFDGVSNVDYEIYISGKNTYNAPARDIQNIEIPGRNGDLSIDNGRYKNIQIGYDCFVRYHYKNNIARYRNELMSRIGYKRIEDSFHPEEFRLGKYFGGFETLPSQEHKQGILTITFDCYPERWLKSGENPIVFEEGGAILNPTMYVAKPLVRVYGTGNVGIGGQTIRINNNPDYIDFDCDLQQATYDSTNMNQYVERLSGLYWELTSGLNGIQLGSGIERVVITPRWYTI